MTRFELLSILDRSKSELSAAEVARRAERIDRPFKNQLRTQLSRLHRWGLARRRWDRWRFEPYAGRGAFVYRITRKGKARLRWHNSVQKST